MDPQLLTYYEAIERASTDMLTAARAGNWDEVVKLEGACVLLISQLKHAAEESQVAAPLAVHPGAAVPNGVEAAGFEPALDDDEFPGETALVRANPRAAAAAASEAARTKARIMQRILMNDAEIRQLAEPWLQTLDETLQGRRRTLH